MYKTIISILILTVFACKNQETINHVSASISIPQNSGLALVKYRTYTLDRANFYVTEQSTINLFLDPIELKSEKELYNYDTLATYPVSIENQRKLKETIERIDSLGHHSAYGCTIQMGETRFFISASVDDKQLDGFIANCYRQHVFDIVDILNECYPEGNVLDYDKSKLIDTEKECNTYNFGIAH